MEQDALTIDMTESDSEFRLEPSVPPGEIPQSVLDELCEAKRIARDYAASYADAIKAQAEKYQVNGAALKRYVAAIVGDTLETLDVECEHIAKLMAKR